MNKLCYRIVFNKTRGLCMAVRETARSRTKGPGQGAVHSPSSGAMRLPALRRMPCLFGLGLGGMVLAGSALGQIVADRKAPGQQQATVLNTANGVLQVNIQTPSAAGVSRNVYSQFDVPKAGAVLNNSRTNVQTQLGGWVQANPWVSKGTARVILNEVNSSNPSRLQGFIEVAGDRAETIVANPAGIVVDGGGFINVSRATLTTGTPTIEDGFLKGYSVQRGLIVIDGAGLDASRTDYTALITRSLQVNAGIWAQHLNVITGANQVEEAMQTTVTQATQPADAKPMYAVDVAGLGGMYANQIYLIGTEAGVGVRNAGEIGAAAGDLVVTAGGRLENSGTLQASQNMRLGASDVANRGTMQARETLALTTGSLSNGGRIQAGVEASIKVQGDVDNEAGYVEAARVDIAAETLHNAHGSIVQTGAAAFAIDASQLVNVRGTLGRESIAAGTVASDTAGAGGSGSPLPDTGGGAAPTGSASDQSGGTPPVTGPAPALADGRLTMRSLDNTTGSITANGDAVVRAEELDNRGGNAYLTSLTVAGSAFDNTGGTVTVLRNFVARTASFVNDQGKLLVGATLDGKLGSFSNRQGLVQAGQLAVHVERHLDNSAGTLRQMGSATADISVGDELALDRGVLEVAAGLRLHGGSITGSGSTLNVTGDLTLDAGNTSAAKGTWLIGGSASLHTGALDNSGGKIATGAALAVDSAALNNAGGAIAAATDASIAAGGAVDNSHGLIQGGRDLTLTAAREVDNRAGTIETLASDSALKLAGATIDNSQGRITNAGAGKTTLEAKDVKNGGVIGGNGDVEITANTLTNEAAGRISSFNSMDMSVRGILRNAGSIDAGGDFRMSQYNARLENHGTLVALGDIDIAVAAIDNTSGHIATMAGGGGMMSLQAASLVNTDGLIDVDGQAVIKLGGSLNNERGNIRVGGDLALNAGGQLENRAGNIETAGRMQLHGGEIGNQGGRIVAAGVQGSSIEADHRIDNNGLIGANGQLTVKAETFDNGAQATLSAAGNLDLAVRSRLTNDGGTISTAGALNFDEAGTNLVNRGSITSAGATRLTVGQLNNDGGAISTLGGSLGITANTLSNRGGRIMAGADASVVVRDDLDNDAGRLQAGGSLSARAGGVLRNREGAIEALGAHGALAVGGSTIDNRDGRIVNVGDGAGSVSATGHIDNSGLIAGNGWLAVTAATTDNAGTVSSAGKIELAVGGALNNSGTISAATALHSDQAGATLRNSGTIVSGGPLEMVVKTIDNRTGRIATAQGSNADMALGAQDIINQGGIIMVDRNAAVKVRGDFDNRSGLVQAKGELQIGVGGILDTSAGGIETLSADSSMQLHAGAVRNEGGSIVNAGTGDTRLDADTTIVNNGQIAGNGVLGIEAQSVSNGGQGSISAAALVLHAHASLENAGDISSRATLRVDGLGASLSNRGNIVANGDVAIHGAAIVNDGGTVATTGGSGASISLDGTSLSNQSGRIVADRALTLGVDGALNNKQGILLSATALEVRARGDLDNAGGVIEATGSGATLALQANAIHNSDGRIVNVGQGATSVEAVDSLDNSGLIAGGGRLDLRAAKLLNQGAGMLASGGAMTVSIGTRAENVGGISSGGTLDIAAQTAEVRNAGVIVATGAVAVTSAVFDNDGGQLATAKGSSADLKVDAASISNRGGMILSDRDVRVTSANAFDNTRGTLQVAGSLQFSAVGAVGNDGGVIESLDPSARLNLHAGALDNGTGRIVNVGAGATTLTVDERFTSRGLVAGNGSMALAAAELDNEAGAIIASGTTLGVAATRAIGNAGLISSQQALTVDAAAAAVRNSGQVVSGAGMTLDTAAFDNSGGQLVTVADQRGDIVVHASEIVNVAGTIVADGAAQIASDGAVDNRRGTVRANDAIGIHAGGTVGNQEGVIEAASVGATLEVHGQAIDNSAGRLANVGSGATRIVATSDIVNSGMVAGNGALAISARTLQSTASGVIGTGSSLELAVREQLDNAGSITSAGTLQFDQASSRFINSGRIGAGGAVDITAASISNRSGQVYTSNGSAAAVSLHTTSLDNTNGAIAADGLLTAQVDATASNGGGTLRGVSGVAVSVGGALANGSGTIESDSGTLAILAQSVDSSGRIINVGGGATSITSGAIVNNGTIGGNGALDLHTATLFSGTSGEIVAGGVLELAVTQQLNNAGTMSSGGSLHFGQSAASFTNSGRIGAGGNIDITAATISNHGGQLYTLNSSGAAINLQTGGLDNGGGMLAADGLLQAEVIGSAANGGGTLHGGTGTTIHAGSALANGSGNIEAAAGMLEIRAQSLTSSGRIVNAGAGRTTVESTGGIVNSGTIAGNGVLDLHTPTLQNQGGGQIMSGRDLDLDVRQQLANAGRIASGGTLVFDQAGASFTNSGQVAAAGDVRLAAASFNNNGGQVSTVHGSNADITVLASALNNRDGAILADGNASFFLSSVVDNTRGTLQAGANLALTTPGTIINGGGVIETLGAASSLALSGAAVDNGSGRISNAGRGETRLSSQTSIANAGTIAAMGNLILSGQSLVNQDGATIAADRDLTFGISRQLDNHGKINSGGTLTFAQTGATFTNTGEAYAGGNAVVNVSLLNNDGGRLGTGSGSGADLTLTSQQMSNRGGRIATDRDLVVSAHTVNGLGELFTGRDLSVTMDGDYVQDASTQQLRSNRNLSLSVSGNITNTAALEAVGVLTLSGQQISNQAGASIEGGGVILHASGNLTNAGEINGAGTLEILAANVSNSGGIVGGNIGVGTGNLENSGPVALIGASGSLSLGVAGTLNNTGGATLYSSGDMAIGGRGGGGAGAVNNISSTIEAGGNLALNTSVLNNVRENVQIVKVKTVDESVHMSMPSWYQYGDNHNSFETSAANYRPHEVYFVSPSDILEDEAYVTPDGYTIHRAVIRTHANDSAFYVAASGLGTAYGQSSRLTLSEGTRVIYYREGGQAANPDQGGPASNAIVYSEGVSHWSGTISFSNQYGNCSADCRRLITQPGYMDPSTTILVETMRALAPIKEQLEASRDAHHVVVEDQVAPGAGAAAQILAGGNMHLTVTNAFQNTYGDIKARGVLIKDGGATPIITGATLYRTHTFDGTWTTVAGQTVGYQQPSMSEVIGQAAGVIEGKQGVSISGPGFELVDITAGTVGNIRGAINVIGSSTSGAGSAGSHVTANAGTGGTAGPQVSAGAIDAQAGLAGAVAATGRGSGLNAALHAAASGIANQLLIGGTTAESGYVNGAAIGGGTATSGATNTIGANGTVDQSGVTTDGHLSGPVASGRNDSRLGDIRATGGPFAGQQASGVKGAGSGDVTKVAPSGLFIRNPDSNGSYLYETRPQFANQQQWTSSDYLLTQLSFDPATTQKRLGDGFYEQRLVREQLAELTGHTAYSEASDDSTYLQLLTDAVSFARAFGLRPGVALSAEQVRHLTSDIVWMESQTVMLPDGSVETVLVPKVYLAHIGEHALQPGGAIVTGNGVTINTTESIVNHGGVIDGGNGRTLLVAGQDIVNQGGTIKGASVVLAADRDVRSESLAVTETYDFKQNGGSYTSLSNQASIAATGTLGIMAGRDLNDVAGMINAGSATLAAGRNIDFSTIRTGSTYQSQISGYTEKDSSITHQLSRITTSGDLKLAATGDLNLSGTQVSIGTAGAGTGQLLAGGTINIAAVTNEINTSVQNDPGSKQYDKQVHQNQTVVGTGIAATGGLTARAGILGKGAINITASALSAGDAIKLTASDSINIVSMQEQHLSDTASTRTSSSFMKNKTTQQADYVASSQAIGSTLSGKTVDMNAGKDINVLGSAIAGDGDVNLAAAGSINIGASTSTLTEQHHTQVKESGFLSGNGFGFSVGTRTTTTDQSRDATTQSGQSRSILGSLGGNLNIVAGEAIKVSGSDLSAAMNMNLDGRSVTIDPGRDSSKGKFEQTSVQDGFTLAIGGSVVNAVQTVQGMSSAASQSKDSRMQALAAAAAGFAVKDAAADVAKNGLNVSVSLTVGHSESQFTETTSSLLNSGTVLNAGKDITIRATGGGKDSNISVIGSDLNAKGNLTLTADNQVNLVASEDQESQHSSSKTMSAAAGIAASVGTKGMSAGVTASVSASRGNVDGEGTTQINSHVNAGDRLTISSGGDTNLKGAVASGSQVVVDVKGNLNIESVQDKATLDGKRQSASVSGTVGGPGSGLSVSVSQSKVHNEYASVQEQSGIRAGDGGFQVQVAGNTDLKGGVISSSEQAIKDGRNSVATGTLSFSDIQNRDSTEASGVSLGVNVGKNQNGGTFSPSMAPGIGKVSGSQGSVTSSGISAGTLAVADPQAGQAVANLNRDVTSGKDTAQALTKGWTGAQALDEVGAQMQITSAAMPRLAKAIGDYAETRVLELKQQGNPEEAAKWAEGGIYRVAAHAALGAMGGGLNGALGAATAAEAAPTMNALQKGLQAKLADAGLGIDASNVAAKLIAVGTAAAIGGVVGGGAGAVTGLNADANNRQLHESEAEKLAALKQGKSAAAQHRLDAAACALAHCADGVPTSDAEYAKLQALQKEGQNYFAEQMKLKATGDFVYEPLDPARDTLTSYAELLRRTGGAINLGAGSLGAVGGAVIVTGGATTCPETLGLGCAAIPFGAYIAKTSSEQAQQGSQALFGKFQSSEGQRVLDSFNPQTFPGEKDPLAVVSLDVLKLGVVAVAGKVIPKALASAEELARGMRTAESASAKAAGAISPSPTFTFNSIENPGPLANLPGTPAANFSSGKYNATVLTEDLVLYRGGEAGKLLGQWFTREAPESVTQVRIDSAVKSQWIDPKTGILTGSSPVDAVYTIKIPKGTTVYDGPVGYQGGVYLGGQNANQVFVEAPWNIKGVLVLDAKSLK